MPHEPRTAFEKRSSRIVRPGSPRPPVPAPRHAQVPPAWRVALPILLIGLAGSHAAAAPPLDHIIVVIMENRPYEKVVNQPYISTMIANGVVFTNSFAIRHPSQPNYIALWSGSTQGSTDDLCPVPGSPFSTENLGHACEAAGLRWRAYSEDLPWAGSDTCRANNLYARKHDPWTDFGNLDHSNERPYTDLAVDIANGQLPDLAFVIPNLCNDMHDCSTASGDAWLARNVPVMLDALGPNGLLVLTWDESDHSPGNHILTVFCGQPVQRGFASADTVNHYTVLRAICEGLGLTPFMAAASQRPITTVWVDRNLVTNPSFESSTVGWNAYHGATIARVPGGTDGAYALEIQAPANTGLFGVNDAPNWVSPAAAAGARYRCAAWVRSATGTGSAQLQIREFASGVQKGTTFRSPAVPLSSAWQIITTDYVVTNPGTTLDFQVIDVPVTPGEVFQVDAVSIYFAGTDRAPVVTAPAVTGAEGSPVTLNVTAVDPDRNPIGALATDLSALPPGSNATFVPGPGNTTGTLTWTPSFADGGHSYPVSFTASNALTGSTLTTLSVANVNRPPLASLAATPASGVAPLAVRADASASTDPDGPVASYTFDFGDGTVIGPQSSPVATHTFAPGVWTVTLGVGDGEGGTGSTSMPVTAYPNLVANPSFESSTAGWKASSGATLTRVPGGSDGAWALEVQGPQSLTIFEVNDAPNWVNPVAAPGSRYRYTAWVRSAAGIGSARLRIREFLGGVQIGNVMRSQAVALSPGWQMLTADFVATTPGSTLDFQVTDTPAAPGEVFDVDAVSIYLAGTDAAPTVTAPAATSGPAGAPITVRVTASDPDGDAVGSLVADLSSLPPGNDATFTPDPSNTSGSLTWTPDLADAGRSYPVTFTASNALSGSAVTIISVTRPNHPPLAALSVTPAAGVAPLGVTADASASTDPDGPLASYTFDFGDGTVVGPQGSPVATYTFGPGVWRVTLRVDDGDGGSDYTTTSVTAYRNLVTNPSFETSTTGWNGYAGATVARTLGGHSGAFALAVQGPDTTSVFGVNDAPDWVSPVAGAGTRYRYAAWVRSSGETAGAAGLQIRELLNGVQQAPTLRTPAVPLSAGWQMLTVDYVATAAGSNLNFQAIDFPVTRGETFLTDDISIVIVPDAATAVAGIRGAREERGERPAVSQTSAGPLGSQEGWAGPEEAMRASVSPNPLLSQGALSFGMRQAGPVRAQVFDVRGRCVRTLIDGERPAGRQVLVLDGRDDQGMMLPAGMYYCRVRTAGGSQTGRFLVLR